MVKNIYRLGGWAGWSVAVPLLFAANNIVRVSRTEALVHKYGKLLYLRPLVKSMYQNINFLIPQSK